MEMVFRKIEFLIEGDANEQRRVNNGPWTVMKIRRKLTKQVIFIALSVIIAHITMAYLIGIEEVKVIVTQSPSEQMAGFIGLMVFTGIFYGVFAYFREQACIAVCPYGRLQGVLLVKDSIVVAYDWLRGEPRGKLKKNQTSNFRVFNKFVNGIYMNRIFVGIGSNHKELTYFFIKTHLIVNTVNPLFFCY